MTKFDFASKRASDLQPGNPSRRRLFPGNVRRRRRETNRVERGENAPPNGRQPQGRRGRRVVAKNYYFLPSPTNPID